MYYNFKHNKEFPLFQLNIPTQLYAGKNESERIKDIISQFGKRVLVISMQDLSEMAERIRNYIATAEINTELILLENIEPTCSYINKLKQQLKGNKIDTIIGIGGGTAIDTAKALAIALTHSDPIWLYTNLSNRPPLPLVNQILPVIAIPTTSGTGTEVTPYAVLTNTGTNQKGTIQQIEMCPKVAILDPELTKTQPPKLTAATGIDAFVHALESFINISKFSPVAEWAAREAMIIIYKVLPNVYKNLNNLELRLEMSWASTLAGIAISHRGTTVIHAIAEPLGAITHIPHADAVAICTPSVLKYTWSKAIKRFALLYDIFEPFNCYEKSDAYKAEKIVELIVTIFEKVNIVKKIKDYIETKDLADKLLEDVIKYKFRPLSQHPVKFSKNDLTLIISDIIE